MTRSPLRFESSIAALFAVFVAACRGGGEAPQRAGTPGPFPSVTAPASPSVNLAEVLEYARRASAVYGDEPVIRAIVAPGSTLTVADLPGPGVRAFVEVDEGRRAQWVAVRGTANLRNVAEDTEYAKVPALDLGIPIHAGFVEDARVTWAFARPLLRPGFETRLTGHSLGGAIAVLLAMKLRVEGQPLGRAITFGQPKVTTEAGVARFRDLPLLRVVNHDDPVPLLPWETTSAVLGGLYRHLGQEMRLTDRGTFDLFPEHRAEGFLLSSFEGHLGRENPLEHEMTRYLKKIEDLVDPLQPAGAKR